MFFKLERGDKVIIKSLNRTAVVTQVKWDQRDLVRKYQVRYRFKLKNGKTIPWREWFRRRELKKIW